MRRLVLCLFFLTATAFYCAALEEAVDSLKSRLPRASTEDRAEISIRVAQMQLRNADRLYSEGHVDQARAAVDDVAVYFEKARDAAIESKKHQKTVEIAARKMAEKLRDIKRTIAFEDQPSVEQAIRRIEDVRTALLKEMFAENKKEKKR